MRTAEYKMARHAGAEDRIATCRFAHPDEILSLRFRPTPYWHSLLEGRHLGVHRPDDTMCNWTARYLTRDKRYLQRCLGPALDIGRGVVPFEIAVDRAFEWFASPSVAGSASTPRPRGRTKGVNFCPVGDTYTVGHALRDYCEWTRIARSAGGHYNNIVLINYHIVPDFAPIPLEEFNATHLQRLAINVLMKPARFGFEGYRAAVQIEDLSPDELRKRKRTFNSLVTILRMAFRHAWDNGRIETERPWRCLKRVPVVHSPRRDFLTRAECRELLKHSTPALRLLIQGALYSGCRVGELARLRVEDVGFQGYGIRVDAFKRSPARFVFLSDEGMAFFLSCCEGKAGRESVFLSDRGLAWRRQHTGLFRRAIAHAGLPSSFVFHGLRHTYASDLIRAGVPLEVVARQLGHADTRTVAQTYGHLAEHFREQQIREKFTSLGETQRHLASAKRTELEALWESVHGGDWRSYALVSQNDSRPLKSIVQTSSEVLKVFRQAEAAHLI